MLPPLQPVPKPPKPLFTRKPPKANAHESEAPMPLCERELLKGLQGLVPCMDEFASRDDSGSDVIPDRLFDDLAIVVTISCIGPAAQNAMRVHGVPASFLIAKFMTDCGYVTQPPETEQGERFPFELMFLKAAKNLASNKRFSPALKLANSPIAYAQRLKDLGLVSDIEMLDIAYRIANYDLVDCDRRYTSHPSEVTVDEAAKLLSETAEYISQLLAAHELFGLGGKVHFGPLQRYQQRRLNHEIEGRHKSRCSVPVAAEGKNPHDLEPSNSGDLLMFPAVH